MEEENWMKRNLAAFPTDVFEWLADSWKVKVSVSSVSLVDCCDASDCNDKLQKCVVIVSRPDAESVSLSTYWEPEYDFSSQITPAEMLRKMGNSVSTYLSGSPVTPEQLAAIKAFCWVHEGLEPQIPVEALEAFAMTANSLDIFFDTPELEVVLH